MWLFLSFMSAFFFGLGQLYSKRGLSGVSPLWMNILASLCKLFIFTPIAFSRGGSFSISATTWALCILMGMFNMSYYYALEKGKLSISSTLISAYPIVTILLSVIFLHEALTLWQIGMILLIILGGLLISQDGTRISLLKSLKNPEILFPIGGAIGYGIVEFLAKVITTKTTPDNFAMILPISMLIVCLVFYSFDKKGRRPPHTTSKKAFGESILGTAILALGVLAFNYAVALGKASLVTTISSSYAALTVLFAYIFLKEKMTKHQMIGAGLTIMGVIGISM
jgi:transporter family protein